MWRREVQINRLDLLEIFTFSPPRKVDAWLTLAYLLPSDSYRYEAVAVPVTDDGGVANRSVIETVSSRPSTIAVAQLPEELASCVIPPYDSDGYGAVTVPVTDDRNVS